MREEGEGDRVSFQVGITRKRGRHFKNEKVMQEKSQESMKEEARTVLS